MGDMTSIRALVLASATLAAGLACNSNPKVTPSGSGGSSSGTSGGGGLQGGAGGSGVGTPGFTLPDATAAAPPDADPGPVSYPGGITRPCANLECRQTTCVMGDCKQPTCGAGQRTTLRGRVYDPAGKLPLYNVVLYVPNEPLAPIATGPSCDRCDSPVSGKPITSTLTRHQGRLPAGQRSRGRGHPAGDPGRQVAPADNLATDQCLHDQRHRRSEPAAAAAQPAGRQHPPDRPDHRGRRPPGMPDAQDRRRRLGVHARYRPGPYQLLRWPGRRRESEPPAPMPPAACSPRPRRSGISPAT